MEYNLSLWSCSIMRQDVSRLRYLAEKLQVWLMSDEGFGSYLDDFFRKNGAYFDDYQEEHALHYTELHKEFSAQLESEIHGWLSDEGLREESLETILQAGREQALEDSEEAQDDADMVDLLLEALDYQKWIQHVFRLKKRVRERRKVRVRKAPPPPPPPPPG
ncbi:unnamed protein product [Effrenium voratum]|nr:unnamed protein product [Effrenium voratum]